MLQDWTIQSSRRYDFIYNILINKYMEITSIFSVSMRIYILHVVQNWYKACSNTFHGTLTKERKENIFIEKHFA